MINPRSKTLSPDPYKGTIMYVESANAPRVSIRIFYHGIELFYQAIYPSWYHKLLLRDDEIVAALLTKAKKRSDALLQAFRANEKR